MGWVLCRQISRSSPRPASAASAPVASNGLMQQPSRLSGSEAEPMPGSTTISPVQAAEVFHGAPKHMGDAGAPCRAHASAQQRAAGTHPQYPMGAAFSAPGQGMQTGPVSAPAATRPGSRCQFPSRTARSAAATTLEGHCQSHSGAAQNAAGVLLPPGQASYLSTQHTTAAPPLSALRQGMHTGPILAPAAATGEGLGHFSRNAAQSSAEVLWPSAQDSHVSAERRGRLRDPTMVWNNPIQTMRAIPRPGASPTEMWCAATSLCMHSSLGHMRPWRTCSCML